MIIRPMETQGLLAKGALAAGIEEYRSIKATTPAEPPAPGPGLASPLFYLTESFMLQIPDESNSTFHEWSRSCRGCHEPDGKDRIHDTSVAFLASGQRVNHFERIRFPVVQFFAPGHPMTFSHRISASRAQMRFGDRYHDSNSFTPHPALRVNLQHKKIEQFRKFRMNSIMGGITYMAEYEIVIEEEFPGRSPPILVLRAGFADRGRSNLIGAVPLTYKYKISVRH